MVAACAEKRGGERFTMPTVRVKEMKEERIVSDEHELSQMGDRRPCAGGQVSVAKCKSEAITRPSGLSLLALPALRINSSSPSIGR